MQGSFADELYSDAILSSSVRLDEQPIASKDDHLDAACGSDSRDLWYDDDGSLTEDSVEKFDKISDMDREWQKRRNQFHTIGYRDGLIAGKEAAAQEGFNIGFKDSVSIGYKWGLVRGITSAVACLPDGLKEKLVQKEETRKRFECLHESVQSLSTTDALKLFHEGQTRKLVNQNESAEASSTATVLNHQNPDLSVFEDFHGQLRSLITESGMVDVHLNIDQ